MVFFKERSRLYVTTKGVWLEMNPIYLVTAIFLVFVTYTKPSWFWQTRKTLLIRRRIGDRATAIFCYALAVTLIISAII
ncbi:hypothetical protein H6F50_07400 [Coleofasciculus sp. FACHB-712]|uniref:hypothetical protein n=1 Tax=Cyanophyceae TaxID=3028117 RepID=UPI001681DF8D|nr:MULTISPECIES: hypothetical protein [unclassified Coleofasciculus]MBD1942185.1 hypothetical protein [Coleofasciculus sp. FACHB-712]MBD2085964.1 hypothetical protein [Coleofasciculus sp. FACHB-542]